MLRMHQVNIGQLQQPFFPNFEMCLFLDVFTCVCGSTAAKLLWPEIQGRGEGWGGRTYHMEGSSSMGQYQTESEENGCYS